MQLEKSSGLFRGNFKAPIWFSSLNTFIHSTIPVRLCDPWCRLETPSTPVVLSMGEFAHQPSCTIFTLNTRLSFVVCLRESVQRTAAQDDKSAWLLFGFWVSLFTSLNFFITSLYCWSSCQMDWCLHPLPHRYAAIPSPCTPLPTC